MTKKSNIIPFPKTNIRVGKLKDMICIMDADFYDYEMTTQVWQLPDDKDAVINSMKEILDSLVDPDAEDNSVTIVCAETTKTWDIAMIENQGKEKVVKELMDLLTKDDNWDAVWN